MGGDITVNSTPGRGSLFRFQIELPVMDAVQSPNSFGAESRRPCITGYEGPRRSVLIVDDIDSNRKLLCDLLGPLGFRLMEAANGLEAVHAAEQAPPDLILLDHYMPGMDGFTAVQRIRENPALRNVPVIAISASVSEEEQAEGKSRGVDEFLPKPLSWARLSALMAQHLKIQWKYSAPEEPEAPADWTVNPPSREDLERLRDLIRLGDMNALIEQAELLRRNQPACAAFADRIKEWAAGFQEQELAAFVEHFMEKGAP